MDFDLKQLGFPLLTGLVAVGIWPSMPKVVRDLADPDQYPIVSQIVRWLFAFIIVYQGRGDGNIVLTLATLAILFIFISVVDLLFPNGLGGGEVAVPANPPTQGAATPAVPVVDVAAAAASGQGSPAAAVGSNGDGTA